MNLIQIRMSLKIQLISQEKNWRRPPPPRNDFIRIRTARAFRLLFPTFALVCFFWEMMLLHFQEIFLETFSSFLFYFVNMVETVSFHLNKVGTSYAFYLFFENFIKSNSNKFTQKLHPTQNVTKIMPTYPSFNSTKTKNHQLSSLNWKI